MEEVLLKLRQLIGAKQSIAIDDVRGQGFGISMFARVDIEHEVDQRALEPCSGAVKDCKSRGGNLSSTLKVENSQRLAKVHVIFRLEIKFARLSPAANLLVCVLVGTD